MKARLLSMLLAGVMMFSALGTTVSAQEIQMMPEEVTAEEEPVLEAVPEDELTGAEIAIVGGDEKADAVPISLKEADSDEYYVSALVTNSKVNAWYKFTTYNDPGYYNFYVKDLSATTTFRVYLLTEGGETISKSEYLGTHHSSFHKLEPNTTYYIRINNNYNASGNYKFGISYTADPEGDNIETAYGIVENTPYRGYSACGSELDYYKFTTGAAGYYEVKIVNESLASYADWGIKTQWGESLHNGTVSKNKTSAKVLILEANTTYYIWEKSNGVIGFYTVNYQYLPDPEGNTQDAAAGLTEGQEYRTTLCVNKDVDYYKIVPNFSGKYHINLVNVDGSSSMNCSIYSEYGELKKEINSINSGKDNAKTIECTLTKGNVYYLKVAGGSYAEYVISYEKDFPFTDVAPLQEGHWQYEAVEYVYENSIMSGKKATLFDPKANLTRAEFAQVLYNMAGKPYVSYQSVFTDVPRNQWYTNAVIWAYKQGIVSGYSDGRFGIKDNITREQVAKMLYMYSEYKREDVSYRASLSGFPDNGNVSGWARTYVEWAVAMKMISGKTVDGNLCLVPKGQANRAECAAMISRYLQK